jgi:penicillin-binding protein 1B
VFQRGGFLRRVEGVVLVAALLVLAVSYSVFAHYSTGCARIVDEQLAHGPFANTFNIFAAPEIVVHGQRLTPNDLAASLQKSGYGERGRAGTFLRRRSAIEIRPGPAARVAVEPVRVEFSRRAVARIVSLSSGRELPAYELEPQLVTNLSGNREKRRLVRFAEIPRVVVNAVLAAEDKRFFDHDGFDSLRLVKAAWVDFKEGRKGQGASTITMQLARSLWLDPEKTWRRKLTEMLMTAHLEERLSKQQIFEHYANEVYLGRRGTYDLRGLGAASREYFGKRLSELTLPEAATLAGMIQRPGYYNPLRNPDRVVRRRNLVLGLMRANGFIGERECEAARRAPLRVADTPVALAEAPYFFDLVARELQDRSRNNVAAGRDVYTTLDRDLQREAAAAVRTGMPKVARLLRGVAGKGAPVQVAVVALDPHSGAVRALMGGRDYLDSQLNRALARRAPGSAFKPFVFAAAINSGLAGGDSVFTPASMLLDEPTTFLYGDEIYEPGNYQGMEYGELTLRDALIRSANIPTVKIAESVGYGAVAQLARQAGLKSVRGTPAAALGSYDVTPLDLAGSYTVFANNGVYVKPTLLAAIRAGDGRAVYQHRPEQRQVLDPRVNYLVVNMMEDVLRRGTGAGVRAQGFAPPAAGKTGTSRDGWFAGFTSNLVTVVWVGFDDYRDLGLEGAKSALTIWTEFMKRAVKLPRYANAEPFIAPDGITIAEIDPLSGALAGPQCYDAREEYFIEGTEPTAVCLLHGEGAVPLRPTGVVPHSGE